MSNLKCLVLGSTGKICIEFVGYVANIEDSAIPLHNEQSGSFKNLKSISTFTPRISEVERLQLAHLQKI